MAAMIEGLAGVNDSPRSEIFSHPVVAPRWDLTEGRTIRATVRYAASDGYVAYAYRYDPAENEITLMLTGSGAPKDCHILLPRDWTSVASVELEGRAAPHTSSRIADSFYVDLNVERPGVARIKIDRR
jgi:hypothetical protein